MMNIFLRVGIYFGVLGLCISGASVAVAKDFTFGGSMDASGGTDGNNDFNASGDVDVRGEEAGEYERDMKPGLTVHTPEPSQSALAVAAANRQSISIGPRPAPAMEESEEKMSIKKVHTVQTGDTLWDICTTYFGDPYVWPRIWSYNPKITNPNWIYPGDTLWLVPPMLEPTTAMAESGPPNAAQLAAARRRADAILSRNRGFVDSKVLAQSGVVSGAQKEITLLSQFDEAYVAFEQNKDVQVGDEFAAYRILKAVNAVDDPETEVGKLVEILGAVRVISFDKKQRIARVVIDESMHPIERGTMIGPVHRRFDLVPSRVNEKELKGNIVAHLDPTLLFSQHQIVFVDKGQTDGVREGNRFFVVKKRDFYRESLRQPDANEGYPYEVLAELRVLETRPGTSTCLVTGATRALEDGAEVEMVKGY